MPRPLISKAIELVSKSKDNVVPRVILEAPTGYGKSISAMLFYKVIKESELANSFLHVLPLRSIVRDIYLCTLLNSLGVVPAEQCGGKSPPVEILSILREAGLTTKDIAYQMGDLLIGEYTNVFNKQPLFDAKYVVTTLDSFLYNLFRVPIVEIFSTKKHYAIPRLRIFISAVYLDEAHMVFEEENEASALYTATVKALEIIDSFKSPMLIASATMGEKVLGSIISRMKGNIKIVRLGPRDREECNVIEVSDNEFVDKMTSIEWRTELIKKEDVVKTTEEHARSGLRVLVVRDSVKLAVETYNELKSRGINVVLIHGKMTRGDRETAMKNIKNMRREGVVVSTSVIEAGVNVSFDVLVTDGSRPRSVVQRAGRVCREGECEEALVYIVEDKELIDERLLEYVRKSQGRDYRICWRIPFDLPSRNSKGYSQLLDYLEEPSQDRRLQDSLEALASPLFVSSYTIDSFLQKHGYALTRIGIVDLVIGDLSEIKTWRYSDFVLNGLTVPVSLINKIAESIEGVIIAWGENDVEDVDIVCSANEIIDKQDIRMRSFVKCIHEAYKSRATQTPIYTGILARRDCYVRGVGLKT
ncbi:MAG: CRISPR-associated helicase Cas3' [Desulfurococcaceae archaeon]